MKEMNVGEGDECDERYECEKIYKYE